jgi:hypothetical protein
MGSESRAPGEPLGQQDGCGTERLAASYIEVGSGEPSRRRSGRVDHTDSVDAARWLRELMAKTFACGRSAPRISSWDILSSPNGTRSFLLIPTQDCILGYYQPPRAAVPLRLRIDLPLLRLGFRGFSVVLVGVREVYAVVDKCDRRPVLRGMRSLI